MIQSMLLRTGRSELGHPDEVLAVHERILAVSPAQGRDIKVGAGRRVHVIEAGEGPPVVLLHGSSTSSLLLLPLLERLKGLRGIVLEVPGGKWHTVTARPVSVANRASSVSTP
jgi:pimeloyl-ACP methyl ester carboxylesterase